LHARGFLLGGGTGDILSIEDDWIVFLKKQGLVLWIYKKEKNFSFILELMKKFFQQKKI